MRRALLLLCAVAIVAQAAGPAVTVTRYGDSRYYRTVQRRTDSTKAADTYVPTAFRLDSASYAGATPAYRTDGQDIVTTSKAGAYVVREIPYFAKTDTLGVMWFRDPTVSTTSTDTLALQWGGTTVNVNDTTGVWAQCHGGSVNYSLVMHFSGNVNDAGPNGLAPQPRNTPTYASAGGRVGQYIVLDGSNQHVMVPTHASLRGGNATTDNPLTLVAWRYYDDFGAANSIFCKGARSTALYEYSFGSLVTTGVTTGLCYDATYTVYAGRQGTVASAATWAHVAMVYTGSGNPLTGLTLWRNGAQVDSANSSGGSYAAMGDDNDSLGLGRIGTGYMDGNIDEARVLQFALSAGQLQNAFANEMGWATNASLTLGAVKTRLDLDSLSPATGPATGGTTVRLKGTGFKATQGAGTAALLASVTSWNDTLIVGPTAAHAAGVVNVITFNSDSLCDTLVGGFTYASTGTVLTLDSIVNDSGLTAGGDTVRVYGHGFKATQASGSVNLPATILSWNDSIIVARTAPHGAGWLNLIVFNSDSLGDTLSHAWTWYSTGAKQRPRFHWFFGFHF